MLENLDNDKKETESKKSVKNMFQDSISFEIEQLNSIIQKMPKDEAIKKIMELKDDKKNKNFIPVYNYALSYLNGDIQKGGKDGYDALVTKFSTEAQKNVDKILQSIFEAGIEQQVKNEIIYEIIKMQGKGQSFEEIEKYVDKVLDGNQATIEEVETSNFQANVNEEEKDDTINPTDVKYPDADDIKKMYKYKVEGKITSGIAELDQFLEIIQPALNKLIIIPWKLRYEMIDARNDMLDKWKNWQSERKNCLNAWETLKVMDPEMMEGKELSSKYNIKKMQKDLATYFNSYVMKNENFAEEKLTLELEKQNEILEIMNDTQQAGHPITKEEAEQQIDSKKYSARKKVIDYSKSANAPRRALTEECQKLVKNHCRSDDGKISDSGKKYLKGYSYMIDLFNREDKDKIHQFTDGVEYVLDQANGRSKAGADPIESIDVIAYLDGEEEKKNNMKILADQIAEMNKDNSK
ncbi:MAG: hypothetical protein IJ638_01020 [Alphaproteobacteria bacterium]|nr:hypothetical protein [Alphaproteobacteria bacterium]